MQVGRRGWWVAGVIGVCPLWAAAAAFQADSVVVLRVGDGVSSLTASAASMSLDEYALDGTWRQSLALPTVGADDALTLRGAATGEGAVSLRGDGQSLNVMGWGLSAGQRWVATTPVRVASVGADGGVAVRTLSSVAPTLTAVAVSGSTTWVGTSSALRAADASGALAHVANGVWDLQSLGSQTWVGLNGNSQSVSGVYALNTAADGSTSLNLVRNTSGTGMSAFAMLDLNADIPGADTLYLASTTAIAGTGKLEVIKFTQRASGVWGTAGYWELPADVSFNGLAARLVDGEVQLMGTTADRLLSTVDPWGYTDVSKGVIGGIYSWTTLAQAQANTEFRGLALAPVAVPEPACWALAVMALGCCGGARRLTASTSSGPRARAAGGSAPAGGARPSGAGRTST